MLENVKICPKIISGKKLTSGGNIQNLKFERSGLAPKFESTITSFNPNWHELLKQEKCSSFPPTRGIVYKTQWVWQSVKLTRLMSIFTSKKVWIFLKNSAGKNLIQKGKWWKVPCLMPIRVKKSIYLYAHGFLMALLHIFKLIRILLWQQYKLFLLIDRKSISNNCLLH